jgi:hypothetical protein
MMQPAAFWSAIAFPVVHQVFVWLTWRFEIQSAATSRAIGFPGYLVLFFLLFWAVAVSFNSSAALVVTAFSHVYIWVHFYATERPDMDFLYPST